ncbi:type II toxin-antitoxin system HicA family toxin [Desulfovibrio sp. UCD-KL4C]|uniref:type II toxin-antitoxin system HicA family toxin n=1 Tax=Desulfovibrio sp. UCD-KL4C TaxID=2578120 RepID=UPI0025BCD3E8|nr:type II toxin-antitoxin system HicA family toxin [Desulfovibrio sp. UCD-KL4C]
MNSKEIIKKLKAAGFALVSISGSHHKFCHPDGRMTIVKHPRKDTPLGTLKAMERQAGMKLK